jgi:CRISPR-associated protein Csd1
MILQSLHQLYDRLAADEDYGIAPAGHSIQKISFRVVLFPDGRLFEIQKVAHLENGKERPRQLAVLGNGKPSGSGINPCFLWDNTGYMLGYKPDDPKPERSRECFEAFRQRHLEAEQAIGSPAFSAVCRFLESWSPDQAPEHPVLLETTTGFGVFQIAGQPRYVHQDPAVLAWWRKQDSSDGDATRAQCLLTGEIAPVARLQPKVKGVAGGKAEASLVGFNDPAYESYGKSQGDNAPVGEEAAVHYGAALNALLDGPMQKRHRFLLGDTTVVFWTEQPTVLEDVLAPFMQGNAEEEAEATQDEDRLRRLQVFFSSLRKGRHAKDPAVREEQMEEEEDVPFYILGLSSNAARISVRLFYESTVRELLANLRKHFEDTGTTPQPAKGKRKADPEFPPAWRLLDQTARERKEIPPVLDGPFLKAIVTGADYPQAMYDAVLRRIRADRTIDYLRVCVLKGYLVRNRGKEIPMSLDLTNPDPAYRLGRLFAALEKTQADALPGINATIRDRFYSAASATPGVVFPRLLRTYQHHLSQLKKGFRINREKLVQEIVGPLSTFPARLGLPDQGQFAIGYYHQTQDFYTAKEQDSDATDSE